MSIDSHVSHVRLDKETVEFKFMKDWWNLVQDYYNPISSTQDEKRAEEYWVSLMEKADTIFKEVEASGNESATIMAESLIVATVEALRKKADIVKAGQ